MRDDRELSFSWPGIRGLAGLRWPYRPGISNAALYMCGVASMTVTSESHDKAHVQLLNESEELRRQFDEMKAERERINARSAEVIQKAIELIRTAGEQELSGG
jgi:hypothetical protein